MPVALAPTGNTGMVHADGEILAARAAEKFGVPFTLSTMSICSIEDVAEATGRHPFWFQLYVMRDRGFIESLIDRAKAAAAFGVPFTLSTMSICSIEDVAANSPTPFWFQLYMMRDRAFMERWRHDHPYRRGSSPTGQAARAAHVL